MPEAGSDGELEFLKHKQVLVDIVSRIVQERRDGEGLEDLPFIDSMMQNYGYWSMNKCALCGVSSHAHKLRDLIHSIS